MSHLKPAGPATKSKKRLLLPCFLAFLVFLCLTSGTIAQIIENPANGHHYEYVRLRGFITWQTAVQEAQNRGGYLATITDTIESGIVEQLLDNPGERAFLGASDYHPYRPDCQWRWITGEPWSFENWAPGEPGAEEPCINHLIASGDFGGQWDAEAGPLDGFIVEWDAAPQDTLLNMIQWPVSEGGNGHWYAYLPLLLTWDQARTAATHFEHGGVAGHLATITSQEENDFVFESLLLPYSWWGRTGLHWLGAHDDSLWTWVTGEPFAYTNWGYGEPGPTGLDLAAAMMAPPWPFCLHCPQPSQWVSRPANSVFGSIVEFDTEPVIDTILNLIRWPVSQGGNGHWYAYLPSALSWDQARLAAQQFEKDGVVGHLATITSPEENGFIVENLLSQDPANSPGEGYWHWLGGYDDSSWVWVTDEPFVYMNWCWLDDNGRGSPQQQAASPILGIAINGPQPDPGLGCDEPGQWLYFFLDMSYGSIVEFDTEPVPDTIVNLLQWPLSQGGNDHWYAVIPQAVSWYRADSLAHGIEIGGATGHLATVTSPEENQFILGHILAGAWPGDVIPWKTGYWLGGFLQAGAWRWVTGEPFEYTNWADGLIIDPGQEHAITMIGNCWDVNPPLPGQWVSQYPNCDLTNMGCHWWAVVEFDAPVDALIRFVQWPVSEGGNDHWYGLTSGNMSWDEADSLAASCQKDGVIGHLASVTSEEENQFILSQVIRPGRLTTAAFGSEFWLGGWGWGSWNWVSGEPFVYSNWAEGYPFLFDTLQVLAMFGSQPTDTCPTCPALGQWVSRPPMCGYEWAKCRTAVIEFDTESSYPPRTLLVPEDYPTIQTAINAARSGDEVAVGPGMYHESINFMGKAIHVRSRRGPPVTTITNYRTANLVTFDHGETRRAVLEGFTLRGGWMAVLCVGSSPTIVRNICVEQNVWNWSAIGLCGSFVYVDDPTGDPRYSARAGSAAAALINNTIVHSANGGISSFSSEPALIRNNIVAFNAYYGIHQISLDGQLQPGIGYNDVFGHDVHTTAPHGDYINIPDPGPGAISADPMFNPDLTLRPESPCIDAGDPDPRFNDPDGTRNDMGAMFFQQEPGGGVIPTNEWIIVYCSGSVNEVPPLPGVMIRAFDPQGVVCGESVIRWDGSFGLMPIYRDDPYTDRDEGAEPGDLIHFKIGVQDVTSEPPVYWTANGDVFEVCDFGYSRCVNIPLHEGWNLISWNVAFESPIRLALDEIIGCVEVVHSYEQGGLVFDPNLDMYNTLTHVDHHHGYWIRMRCDAVFQACGEDISPDQWIGLETGWNLVSYWPEMPFPVEDGFVTILEHLEEAMGFDHGAQVWLPGFGPLNTLTELRPRLGYWAKVNEPLPLTYPPFGGGLDPDDFRWPPDSGWMSPPLSETSRSWMSVYGSNITVDGVPLAEGTVIEFCTSETVVCGRGVYQNNTLRFTPVYGRDDSGDRSKLYPKEGDAIAVFINGEQVYPGLRWSSDGSRVQLSRLTADSRGLPQTYVLKQNYPNPFNPGTMIAFEVPADGPVNLSIYNVLGQKVRTLVEQTDYTVGRYELEWDGCDDRGSRVSTGVYFYRLTAGDQTLTKKMLLLK